MKIQLAIFVSLMAISFTSAVSMGTGGGGQTTYSEVDIYADDQDSYSSYGVYGVKKSSGGNSACPNEPFLAFGIVWVLCCENEIKFYSPFLNSPVLNSVPPKCCGPNPYDPVAQFCCGGVVSIMSDIFSTTGFPGCCNGVAYDRLRFVCCNNQLMKLNNNQIANGIYECCGTKTSYSASAYGNTQYSAQSQYNGAAGSYGQYPQQYQGSYQDQLINSIDQICCSGKAINITGIDRLLLPYISCCGNQLYNSRLQACCGSVIVERTVFSSIQSCCGAELFDPSSEICCNNRKFPLQVDGKDQKCCATQSYDPKSQKCCAGYIVNVTSGEYNYNAKCCGINLYDAASQICCSGVPVSLILNVPIVNQRCCGFEVYDRTQWTCCNQENKVPKGKKCAYY